jgi:hypothetical protein
MYNTLSCNYVLEVVFSPVLCVIVFGDVVWRLEHSSNFVIRETFGLIKKFDIRV